MSITVLPVCCARCNAPFDLKIVGWHAVAHPTRQAYDCPTCHAPHLVELPGRILRVAPRVVLRPGLEPRLFKRRRPA